ncbi:unnamed protein product [Penicillium discolor]
MDLLLYIFALLPLVQSWTFQYTNSANETTTLHGTKNLDCTDIDLPNRNVASDVNATSCESWKWKSPANGRFRGIKVLVSGAPTATASISTATQTTATTATSTSPSTSSSTPPSTLSGGAIAGIVVGLVCALLIVAAIFFFLGLRKRKAMLEKPADSHPAGVGPAPSYQVAELAASGKNRPAELATNPVHELDAHN